jgi:hypothetical protein
MLEPCNIDGRTNMAAAHCDHRAIRPDIRSLVTFNTHNLIELCPKVGDGVIRRRFEVA